MPNERNCKFITEKLLCYRNLHNERTTKPYTHPSGCLVASPDHPMARSRKHRPSDWHMRVSCEMRGSRWWWRCASYETWPRVDRYRAPFRLPDRVQLTINRDILSNLKFSIGWRWNWPTQSAWGGFDFRRKECSITAHTRALSYPRALTHITWKKLPGLSDNKQGHHEATSRLKEQTQPGAFL